MTNRRRVVALVTVGLLLLVGLAWTAFAQIPAKFTNLTVLSQDIPQRQLVDEMKNYTFALGTRCWYCHDGEGDDLSTFDFAADTKPTKETARSHMKMVGELNKTVFADKTQVTCMTCHQGSAKPEGD